VENGLQARLCEEVADVDGGSEELRVVDHFVTMVVHLRNDVIDLLSADVHLPRK